MATPDGNIPDSAEKNIGDALFKMKTSDEKTSDEKTSDSAEKNIGDALFDMTASDGNTPDSAEKNIGDALFDMTTSDGNTPDSSENNVDDALFNMTTSDGNTPNSAENTLDTSADLTLHAVNRDVNDNLLAQDILCKPTDQEAEDKTLAKLDGAARAACLAAPEHIREQLASVFNRVLDLKPDLFPAGIGADDDYYGAGKHFTADEMEEISRRLAREEEIDARQVELDMKLAAVQLRIAELEAQVAAPAGPKKSKKANMKELMKYMH